MATVTNETQLRNAISAQDPEIIVGNNITLTSTVTVSYAVNMRGADGVSLFWQNSSSNISMFVITAAGNLTIESLTLDGSARSVTIVNIMGGKFTMNDGAVIRNIRSTSAQNAVTVGDLMENYGGTFIMNGGLITGIDSSDAVFSGGGIVEMHNDAAIDGNSASGVTATDTGGVRSLVTMTGQSRISNNVSRQGASGMLILTADVLMGVNEGDAPVVTGNSTDLYSAGGVFLSGTAHLTMRYGAEISGNYAFESGGGVRAYGRSEISMHGDSAIKDNSTKGFGAGVLLEYESTITMEDNAVISGNEADIGGGIHLQTGSVLNMTGNSSILDNTAESGAGIYLAMPSTANIGGGNSQPKISGNQATDKGGGIFISAESRVDLSGQAQISGNTAQEGKGVYKIGDLHLSQSPAILDGLFFDESGNMGYAAKAQRTASKTIFKVPLGDPRAVEIKIPEASAKAYASTGARESMNTMTGEAGQAHTDNVPIIADNLTDTAVIRLESSGYVSPGNVPLVIADKHDQCQPLGEPDRAAWLIPVEFSDGHTVLLTDPLDQVIIDFETYRLTYHGLNGAENPNPDYYTIDDLPITLAAPGPRPGYAFKGWYNADGELVTEISAGMTGDLLLSAIWEKVWLSFDGNADCVCNIPKKLYPKSDGNITIPTIVPCRKCHHFICWNMPDSGSGKTYFPGDTFTTSDKNETLYAQWQPDSCCCMKKGLNEA